MGAAGAGPGGFHTNFPFDLIAAWGWAERLAQYPALKAWRERCQAREAWKRALDKGNGYDLGFRGERVSN